MKKHKDDKVVAKAHKPTTTLADLAAAAQTAKTVPELRAVVAALIARIGR